MKVKIKKLTDSARLPKIAKDGDAGADLVATSKTFDEKRGYLEFGTGLSIEIPRGYVGLIFPRSSISNVNLTMANCVGVIDSGYRGEVKIRYKPDYAASAYIMGEDVPEPIGYDVGNKIAQLIIMKLPTIEFEEVKKLSRTKRGDGGFGSSGG